MLETIKFAPSVDFHDYMKRNEAIRSTDWCHSIGLQIFSIRMGTYRKDVFDINEPVLSLCFSLLSGLHCGDEPK